MVNRDFIARMRPGSYLLNTARGGLVVETDLRDSLVSGHLAGAGLDVLNHEPPEPGNPLIGLANVVLSPHIAGTDTQSMREMAELAATTIVELSQNRWPANCVVNSEAARGLEVVNKKTRTGQCDRTARSCFTRFVNNCACRRELKPGTSCRSRNS